jgi:hypothetical protein
MTSPALSLQWPNATPFGIEHISGKDYLKLGSRYWMMVGIAHHQEYALLYNLLV